MTQMNFKRCEMKYMLTDGQRARLMEAMSAHMVPDEYGPSTVLNVYCDTPSSLLIRRSLEHPAYKEKVRLRSYGTLGQGAPVFLELKKKSDGIVYKRRCTMAAERADAFLAGIGDPQTQIERELDYSIRRYGGLRKNAFIAYDREAFYASDDHEFRMTFDVRVRVRWDRLTLASDSDGEQILPDGQNLLEVKAGGAVPLWLARFLSEERIFKASFSKYGTAYQRRLAEQLSARRQPAPAPSRIETVPSIVLPHAPYTRGRATVACA